MLIALIISGYFACEDLEHTNPVDPAFVLKAPTNLSATIIDDQSLQLTWSDNCSYESGFSIERNDGGGFAQIAEVNTDVVTYTDNGLTYGQSYTYQVKAFTDKNESDYSNELQATVKIPTPTNLTATAIDDQSLRLAWTDNCAYESGYRIERNDGSGFSQISEVSADLTTYTDTGLTYGQSYTYRVKAFINNKESDYSNESDVIEMIIPAPTNLTATIIDDQSVRLTWDDNCIFESGYKVERKDEGGIFTEIADLSANTETYIDQGLTKLDYAYRVRAYSNFNSSNYCEEVSTNMDVVIDIDGNTYLTVKIGNQWWMAENLKVTRYRNGDAIPNVTNNSTWIGITTGAYCNYSNDEYNVNTYGRLYNWYAVNDNRNIAPAGWHVPSDAEWQTLIDYLDGSTIAGGKMKEVGTTHWQSPNTGANNISGFTALPAGIRGHLGEFSALGEMADFWSSTAVSTSGAWNRRMYYNSEVIDLDGAAKCYGFSIRCVKD